MGPDALPAIEDAITHSKTNGLSEYILAIAAEKIAKVDLKHDNFGWTNAKEWVIQWKAHLKSVPKSKNDILSNLLKTRKVGEITSAHRNPNVHN